MFHQKEHPWSEYLLYHKQLVHLRRRTYPNYIYLLSKKADFLGGFNKHILKRPMRLTNF